GAECQIGVQPGGIVALVFATDTLAPR
ncbi:MAG: hypothetical protein QOH33_981, partial [Paraburkholderia sp.]|nr:hypothetical protein [Paraburkholderia sp.]